MYYELEILDDIVLNRLNPLQQHIPTIQGFEEILSQAQGENWRIKIKLVDDVLNQPDEPHIRIFIRVLQMGLTNLADKLYNYQGYENEFSHQANTINLKAAQKRTLDIIDDLLNFVRKHFLIYFDVGEKPPIRTILNTIEQFTDNLSKLGTISEVPNKFVELVINELSFLISNPETITYHKIFYFEHLVKEILSIKNPKLCNNLSQSVIRKLIKLDFNTPMFIELVTDEYTSAIEELDSINDKLEKLSLFFKEITQIHIHRNYTYLSDHKSTKELLLAWIIEEMAFLEKKVVLSSLYDKEAINVFKSNFKIQTTLSVPQLAYFLRLLVELDVITEVSVKDLLKFYSIYTRTKKTESVSAESLRIKYYDVQMPTTEEIKNLVIRMLNLINNRTSNWFILCSAFTTIFQDYIDLAFYS